nr:hypothetical protein [Tanacetum cinerariifolium]
MDDPNITMKEYIRLEEEKTRRQGRTLDWQTARYVKTEYYENDNDSFTNLETEYPAIVFDDIAFSREPTRTGAEKVTGVDLFYLRTVDHRTTNVPYLLAQFMFRHAEKRKSGARLSGGHFIGRLVAHFGLVGDQGLRGLSVVVSELSAVAVGAPGAVEDAPAVDEGAQAVPAPVQAPQPPPSSPQPQTMSQMIERIEEEICMTQLMDASGYTYQAFNSILVSSSRLSYERRVRPRTGDANTFVAPQTDD